VKTIFVLPLLAFLAVSCASNTPQSRIEKNPQIFRSLSEAEKALVEVGKIQNGMTPPAVFLAWGPPDGRSEGESNGKRYEHWLYRSLSPVVVQSAWGGWGPGWAWGPGCGWYRGGIAGPGWGPWGWNNGVATDIAYVHRTSSWVIFVNNRVESWELCEDPR
jgi:hypothetical protein